MSDEKEPKWKPIDMDRTLYPLKSEGCLTLQEIRDFVKKCKEAPVSPGLQNAFTRPLPQWLVDEIMADLSSVKWGKHTLYTPEGQETDDIRKAASMVSEGTKEIK